jgi:hypothetical protein
MPIFFIPVAAAPVLCTLAAEPVGLPDLTLPLNGVLTVNALPDVDGKSTLKLESRDTAL